MALPVLVDPDEEFDERPFGQLGPHGGPDLLEDRATLPDDDPLLGVALHEDLHADAWPLPLGDPGGDGVRDLVAGHGEELLADYPENATALGVDKGVRVALKASLTDRTAAGQADGATFPVTLVVAGEDSQVTLLEEFSSPDGAPSWFAW